MVRVNFESTEAARNLFSTFEDIPFLNNVFCLNVTSAVAFYDAVRQWQARTWGRMSSDQRREFAFDHPTTAHHLIDGYGTCVTMGDISQADKSRVGTQAETPVLSLVERFRKYSVSLGGPEGHVGLTLLAGASEEGRVAYLQAMFRWNGTHLLESDSSDSEQSEDQKTSYSRTHKNGATTISLSMPDTKLEIFREQFDEIASSMEQLQSSANMTREEAEQMLNECRPM